MPPSRERPRWSAAKWAAAILAVAVHIAFVLFLVFSVNWQSRKPEILTAELYAPEKIAPPKPQPEPPKPQPEPPKPQPEPPTPQPEPPKPAPEPPKPPQPSQADIELKEKQERLKKEQAERERQEAEKREAEKREAEKRETEKREAEKREADRKAQEKRLAETRERQAREAQALQAQAERERLRQQQIAADQARAKSATDYIRRIQAKVRGNVTLPPDLNGNPEAIFDVVQLPTGEIIDVQLVKSSGARAYDEAVQRAILKSSPLPLPDSPDLFRRSLTLKFRPLD
jgi:colicin import membrane protein